MSVDMFWTVASIATYECGYGKVAMPVIKALKYALHLYIQTRSEKNTTTEKDIMPCYNRSWSPTICWVFLHKANWVDDNITSNQIPYYTEKRHDHKTENVVLKWIGLVL